LKIDDESLLDFIFMEDNLEYVTKRFNSVADSLHTKKSFDLSQTDFRENLKSRLNHPLDGDVIKALEALRTEVKRDSKNAFYSNVDDIKRLWSLLVKKAVIGLRFFDAREPYHEQEKAPKAYGLEELERYFEKYADFEGLLYGSNKSYRDHVIHVFRTWLVGVFVLLRGEGDNRFIDKVAKEASFEKPKEKTGEKIQGAAAGEVEGAKNPAEEPELFNFFEKLSMWTLTALCHDLGYPLEKAQKIFHKTNEMLEYFVTNPNVSLDISFSGVQDYINDYIVKFLSSRMVERPLNADASEGLIYTGRVQPKYYIKFSKSLEKYSHGIVSSIILYKSLVYFLEAEFNVNEDYYYNKDECKQYYIRREILRAIATHTCSDIYHLNSTTLPFLLILCDELQEWNRKSWGDFYKSRNPEEREVELEELSEESIKINEITKKLHSKDLISLINVAVNQYSYYKKLFRDGQDALNRKFDFSKNFEIHIEGDPTVTYYIHFSIPKNTSGSFTFSSSKKDLDVKSDLYKKIYEKFCVSPGNTADKIIFND